MKKMILGLLMTVGISSFALANNDKEKETNTDNCTTKNITRVYGCDGKVKSEIVTDIYTGICTSTQDPSEYYVSYTNSYPKSCPGDPTPAGDSNAN